MPKFHTPTLGESDIRFTSPKTLPGRVLYSTGYSGMRTMGKPGKIATFDAMVRRLGLFVVDTRKNPFSQAFCWRKAGLSDRLGDLDVFPDGRYLHVPEFGNVNYANGGPIQIENLEYGLDKVLHAAGALGLSPLLICTCDEVAFCHRQVVARAFAEHYDKWVEINYWDDPKALKRDGTVFGEVQEWKEAVHAAS